MSSKNWIYTVIFFVVFLIISTELVYQCFHFNRTQTDYIVNDKLSKLNNKYYETILIGDSLSQNAISTIKLHSSILNLTTNNAITLAGQYFVINRYLENNRKPKNIYLFCTSDHLYQDLDTQLTYLYFTTVFNKLNEINEIKKIRPSLYEVNFTIDRYTESRLNYLKFSSHYKPKKKNTPVEIDETSLSNYGVSFMNEKIMRTINKKSSQLNLVNEIPKVYIKKIHDMSKENNINFTIVMEPMPKQINDLFMQSEIYDFIKMEKINLENINDYYTFSNYFFRHDGVHVYGKANNYYQNLIDKHIVDIY